jgi:hypothetical protein
MSKLTKTAAAIAGLALTMAACDAAADLTRKVVRDIVRQEITKVPRLTGPPGRAGWACRRSRLGHPFALRARLTRWYG